MKFKLVALVLVFSFVLVSLTQICIPQLPLAYAQEEDEEDEEPVQTRPNPMQNVIRGTSDKAGMRKGVSKMGVSRRSKAAADKSVSVEGVDGESMPVDPYDSQINSNGVLMPIDPLGAQTETGSVMQEDVGSASWDPSEMPAGWDPFDKEANLDSAEMHQ